MSFSSISHIQSYLSNLPTTRCWLSSVCSCSSFLSDFILSRPVHLTFPMALKCNLEILKMLPLLGHFRRLLFLHTHSMLRAVIAGFLYMKANSCVQIQLQACLLAKMLEHTWWSQDKEPERDQFLSPFSSESVLPFLRRHNVDMGWAQCRDYREKLSGPSAREERPGIDPDASETKQSNASWK